MSWDRSRYGSIGERAEWKNALEHYHWDRLAQAYELALNLGVGSTGGFARFYRQIEAEHITRERSTQQKVSEWLTIEHIPEETAGAGEWMIGVQQACDHIAARLGWSHEAKTMVSVLAEESDAPWAVGRFGYMVDKHPYDKICLPLSSLYNGQLFGTVLHEYAHVITHNVSAGRIPRYLDEAIAMVAAGDVDTRVFRGFAQSQIRWLSREDLNIAYVQEEQSGGGPALWYAYQQSAAIGTHLVELKGEAGLAELLKAFSDNSTWTELKMAVTGQTPSDEALQQVYGMSESELFESALRALR